MNEIEIVLWHRDGETKTMTAREIEQAFKDYDGRLTNCHCVIAVLALLVFGLLVGAPGHSWGPY